MADDPVICYELWREDDNGCRFLVGCHADRQSAEEQLALVSRALHKQFYWISERADGLRTCCPGEK